MFNKFRKIYATLSQAKDGEYLVMPRFHRVIAIAIATSLEMGIIVSLRTVFIERKR